MNLHSLPISRPWWSLVLLLGALALGPSKADAQSVRTIDHSAASFTYTVSHGDQAGEPVIVDLQEMVRVIVQFTEPPLARLAEEAGRGDVGTARSLAETQHTRFLGDLAALTATAPGGQGVAAASVHRSFVTALNGVTVTVPRAVLGSIRALDYVSRVDEDRRVQTMASGPLAAASAVHSAPVFSSATGEGIVIAVIDTGIDYTHPAMGGGIGPAFKVIGGYDFINNDADPMDDNGHGTHVAGIAAGNTTSFQGVAPQARLLAYKVLDAGGFGDFSSIIAGIEAAIDPNGDGVFDDRAHILNLSLGGDGDADDPLSTAVNNAVAAGSVVVVAAGNSGGYLTVGTPASAESAVTVGAIDAAGIIAPFSSRGPAAGSFGLKPDVVAPGVDISSSVPGGGYQSFSGTSMASPYVAGAAALLLHQHPTWTPDIVKSALMSTAENIGEDLYTQGTGRVRTALAAAVQSAGPGSFSFGMVDAAPAVWTSTRPLPVRNLSGTSQTYSLSVVGGLPAGITVSVHPTTLTVPAGGTGLATVNVALTNAQVPYGDLVPPTLIGEVVASSSAGDLRMPFGMLKASHVRVQWDEELGQIWFIRQDAPFVASYWAPPSGGVILVPPGTYTVAAPFARWENDKVVSAIHVKEQVQPGNGTLLAFQAQDLSRVVRVSGRTHTGGNAPLYMIDYMLHLPGAGGGLLLSANTLSDRFRTSAVSATTIDVAGFALSPAGADYVSVHKFEGPISTSMTFLPDHTGYRRVDLDYVVPPGVSTLYRQPGLVYDMIGDPATAYVNVYTQAEEFQLQAPFRQTRYLAPIPAGSLYHAFTEMVLDHAEHPWGGSTEESLQVAPLLMAEPNKTTVYRGGLINDPAYATAENPHTLSVGMTPFWFGRLVRQGANIRLLRSNSDAYFLGATYGRPGGGVSYEVTRQGQLVSAGEVTNVVTFGALDVQVDSGASITLTHSGHRVMEHDGTAEVLVTFDARAGDRNPPRLVDLQTRAGGVPAVSLPHGNEDNILVSVKDESPIGPVTVDVQRLASGTWERIASLEGAGPHAVPVPTSLTPGYYGLRVTAADAAAGTPANRMDYRASVAFAYQARPLAQNGVPTAPQLQSPSHDTVLDPATTGLVTFSWTSSVDPDPADQLSYALRFFGPGLDTTLTAWDLTELTVDLTGRLQEQGIYHWSVTTSDGFAVVPSTSTFRVLTPGAVDNEPGGPPLALSLDQNYPNPFATSTTIAFTLAEDGPVRLSVYDLLGRRVATLVDDTLPAGAHTVPWQASDSASGTYIYRLEAAGTMHARRLTLMR